jgi:hypothetical protein
MMLFDHSVLHGEVDAGIYLFLRARPKILISHARVVINGVGVNLQELGVLSK